MSTPRVTIIVSGGNLQDICTEGDIDVLVLDWDNAKDCDARDDDQVLSSWPATVMSAEEMDAYIEKTNREAEEELSH